MSDKKLISVIITRHDRPLDYLERAVRSVLAQTYPSIELLIVDSGENIDDTRRCVDSITSGQNTPIIIWSKGASGPAARNIGALSSNGTYLAFLDDDDEWRLDKLEKQMACFDDSCSIVYSNYESIDRGGKKRYFFENDPTSNDLNTRILGENVIGCTSMPLVSKESFLSAGGFDESFRANQEWDLWIRMLQKSGANYCPIVAGIKYYNPGCISSSKKLRISGWFTLLVKHNRLYRKNPEQLLSALDFFRWELFDKQSYFVGFFVVLSHSSIRLWMRMKNK